MTNSELELWDKIRQFEFDKPGVKLTFAKRLAKENGILLGFANDIVEEYRKFLFLCCVSPHQVSPSHFVDEAWHLHLTYTKSYWIGLCQNTLGRDVHHDPTEGGGAEDAKFRLLYEKTLEQYEQYFSKAPEAIWPKGNEANDRSEVTSKRRHWTIPKPAFLLDRHRGVLAAVGLLFVALVLGCTDYASSFWFLIPIGLVMGVIVWLIWRHNRHGGGSSGCGSGCGGILGSSDSDDSGGDGGGDSGCSGGCSGGCGGGD
jgi:hypothetical protein